MPSTSRDYDKELGCLLVCTGINCNWVAREKECDVQGDFYICKCCGRNMLFYVPDKVKVDDSTHGVTAGG